MNSVMIANSSPIIVIDSILMMVLFVFEVVDIDIANGRNGRKTNV